MLKLDRTVSHFFKSKLITLYLPYVCIALIVYLVGIPLGDETISVYKILKIFLMLYTPGMIGAAWFICCLFYSELLLKLLFEVKSFIEPKLGLNLAKTIYAIIIVLFAILGYNITFPLGISRIFICTFFVWLGNSISR